MFRIVATLVLALGLAFQPVAPRTLAVQRFAYEGSQADPNAEKGKGGMADTRDPEPFKNEDDPRKSISVAPSFEEYLKQRK